MTTVPSESAFSTGERVVSDFRSRLSTDTVEALICLQDWMRAAAPSPDKLVHEVVAQPVSGISIVLIIIKTPFLTWFLFLCSTDRQFQVYKISINTLLGSDQATDNVDHLDLPLVA